MQQKRPDLWQTKDWFFHHDNAPAHAAISVRQFLAKNTMIPLPHASYSPDLAPCDFFLFPRMKRDMKGQRFDDVEAVKKKTRRKRNCFYKTNYCDWAQPSQMTTMTPLNSERVALRSPSGKNACYVSSANRSTIPVIFGYPLVFN